MSSESFSALLSGSLAAALSAGFLAGFVFSFYPVALGAIPVSLACVTRSRATREAVRYGTLFVAGLLVTHLLIGVTAGLGGLWGRGLLGRTWGFVLGPLLIVLGLVWAGWVRLPAFALRRRAKRSPWAMKLDEAILVVSKQAPAEGESAAAEHLLRALEAVCSDESCMPLDEADRILEDIKRGHSSS